MNIIIYDLEIIKGIPNRDGSREEGIEYCGGWHDHASMGISVNCAYDYQEDRYRVFTEDNKDEWQELCEKRQPLCVGFNSIPFDNAVLSATASWFAPSEDKCYDLLREQWAAAGLGSKFDFKTHGGFGLDDSCKANGLPGKTGNGALAPVMWQRGQIGKVIDYCITDVHRTKLLFDRVLNDLVLIHPRNSSDVLRMRDPLKA